MRRQFISSSAPRKQGFGRTKFTQLDDAPPSYTGHKGHVPVVNDLETALELKFPYFWGTGAPPSAVGKLDGTLYFKYIP